jgi:imidazolonepropionase-like amidohydrolase
MAQLPSQRPMVLRPEWFIDGIADQPISECEILIEDGLIGAVRAAGSGSPGLATVIDLPGVTVLPGLIDCHVHYTIDANPEIDGIAQAATDPPERAVLIGAANARRALLSGVTTARSAGASRSLDVPLAAAIERGDILGPRLLPAGAAVTITGGHGTQFGVQVDSIQDMITAVRALVRDGSMVIKVIASEAAMLTTDLAAVEELSVAEMSAMTSEAKRLHRRVLAHAQSSAAVIAAAKAGVDSVEHAFLADEQALRCLKDSGAFLTPTLSVTDVYSRLADLPPESRSRQAEISIKHRESCEMAIRLGIPLATGTDCGVRAIFSDMLALEVELMHSHGLSPMAAIQSATANSARLLGISDEVGTLAPGKRADLLAVMGDPTGDLSTLHRPVMVIKAGDVVRWPDPGTAGAACVQMSTTGRQVIC